MDLYEQLENYSDRNIYPMHMPGHKRNKAWQIANPYSIDITEIEGFDNLHHPKAILKEEMIRAARVYRTRQSFYLINGSSAGILAAISACAGRNSAILMARNCHKSVYHAVMLRGLKPFYLFPAQKADTGILLGIKAADVGMQLELHKEIQLVVITSPTYEGMLSEIKEIADVVHQHGALLFVDEAHGAHLAFHKDFSENAVFQGADLVVHSIHKTLPALTQTALLHVCSERVRVDRIAYFLNIYQSTSPSYILMAGISHCIQFLDSKEGLAQFAVFLEMLKEFYRKTKNFKKLKILNWTSSEKDISKIIILVRNTGMTGVELYDILLSNYRIQPEMAAEAYVLCITSVCDTQEGFLRLFHALESIELGLEDIHNTLPCNFTIYNEVYNSCLHPQRVRYAYELEDVIYEVVPFFESIGRIVHEMIYLYPPGIPILVPGEVMSLELYKYLERQKKYGLELQGLADENADYIRVSVQ